MIITNTQINDNTAHLAGGGVHNSSSMLMVNSTIARNSAQGYGGGADNAALATFYHVTIAENTSPQGAGLSSSGAAALLTLRNSAIAKNGPGGNCVSGGAYFSQGYNLDDDATCVSGPYDLIADPLFDPKGLANNGGLTETYALLPGSPAIDAADVLSGMIGIAGDQRGYVRSVDGNGDGVAGADIGAYEATAPSASWYPICGNGNGEFPEECDDANTVSGDGCSGICQLEAPAPSGGGTVLEQTPMVQIKPEAVLKLLPICGNGKVEGFEECDHGANNGKPGDTCNAQCKNAPQKREMSAKPWYQRLIFRRR